MKTNDLLLLLVAGVLGYVLLAKLSNQPLLAAGNSTSSALGGTQSTTLPQNTAASIASAIGSIFNFAGTVAQTNPKTI